ncbi:MAG TPA: N-acetylmuramic acid 6-phosphate etherase [Sphingomonadaceae bacterium]|nr:N-acetylmuramic acid 6-phosphate etherase [Sphingomonadaceae bacterium]
MQGTEIVDPRYVDIDFWTTEDAVEAILDGQLSAVASLRNQTTVLARAAEAATPLLSAGGRLVYVGAGTSGRIAVQDGVELGPTFGWPKERLAFLIAGGLDALSVSAEGAEDDRNEALRQLATQAVGRGDVLIGVAASGRTPFTVAALEEARRAGALTIGVANNPHSPLLAAAEFAILADTGSEPIAGSTRLKAGTAQKIVLNILSTAIMLRLGRVYRGLMVDMVISNDKLLHRGHQMVRTLSGCSEDAAVAALTAAGNDIKKAVLIARGIAIEDAEGLLARNDRILRRAIDELERR